MAVHVTCKFDKDPIKSEDTILSPVRSTRTAIVVALSSASVPVTLWYSHSSESIHIWTLGALVDWLSFHDSLIWDGARGQSLGHF